MTALQTPRVLSAREARRAKEAIASKWAKVAAAAQQDVNAFLELSFFDDQTPGSPAFKQQWFHREWQAFWGSSPATVMHGATGFGKTEQLVGRVIWELGRDGTKRVALIRKSHDPAAALLLKVKRQIESNQTARAIFPKLRPGDVWSNETLRVAQAGLDTTTNSVTPFGVDGPLLGTRADIAFLDDVNDPENTANEEQRNKIITWADAVVRSRLTTHGWMAIIANAWHLEDLAFTYSRRPGMPYRCYPAEREGVPIWPAFRGREWLDEYLKGTTPITYARTMLCLVGDDTTRIFTSDVLARAWSNGAGLLPQHRVQRDFDDDGNALTDDAVFWTPQSREQWDIIVGTDLSTGKTQAKRKSDFTVFFVLGVSRLTGRRRVFAIERGRWTGPVIVQKLSEIHRRYKPRRFIVEDNGQQQFLIDFARAVPGFEAQIEPFTTTGEKWHEDLGIQGVAAEMYGGRWEIPGPADRQTRAEYAAALPDQWSRDCFALICSWESHLKDLKTSHAQHTPDDIMAMWFARQGALRLGAGVFDHDKAREMGEPPADFVARELAGNGPTVAGVLTSEEDTALAEFTRALEWRR